MATKKELKKVSIKKDYVLYCLLSNAGDALGVICSYMQENTPYGDEYIKAFNAYKKALKAIAKFEDALAACSELENYKKKQEEL